MKLFHGAHVSIANGFLGAAIQAVEEYESNAMQISVKSPRRGGLKHISDEEAKEFKKYAKQAGLKYFVAHCSYLLNFAKPPKKNKWALDLLINDIECIHQLGGNGVVLHIGKYLDMKKEVAFKNIVESIHRVLDATKKTNVPILLETTAGQGTEIGFEFGELQEIYKKINRKKRVKFCVDTCHIFSAGYDLRTKKAVQETFRQWNKTIGTDKIACIHFNDSKKDLGFKVDRHELLGEGTIGKVGLTEVAKFAQKNNIPVIIETPEKTRTHKEDLDILKSWL
jgi:deoxyribonuclease-4